ncbi:MAG TPA: TrmH family RNA methyltransferase [Candidatus Saccharimonadales bacterium]
MTQDLRNVTDELKGKEHNEIVKILDSRGVELEIAIENLERDFNMGTIVRSANAFGVRHVHVIGRRQWNKRGAMATDKYLHVYYHASVSEFSQAMAAREREIVAIDNVPGSKELNSVVLPQNAVLVFGAEGPGLSDELLEIASRTVAIEQLGSTRSVNVGVAAGIVMYRWLQEWQLDKP